MSHKQVTYPLNDVVSHQDIINSWFNLTAINGSDIEKELEKAQLLLNHMDHIRTIFSNKLVMKRRFK